MKIGILKEGKIPADERVAFSPEQCVEIMQKYPCTFYVQRSMVRRIRDEEYAKLGIEIVDELSFCDVLFGIKEVPKEQLIENKTYVFFSHTIKKQAHNKELLRKILEKNIRLIDYECMTNEKGLRLLGFGKYAGIVGTYNGLRMIGLKEGFYTLKKAHDCADQQELHIELKKVKLPALRICLTGMGRVASGAIEILKELDVKQVDVHSFLTDDFNEAVFVQLDVTDYNTRLDNSKQEMFDFFHHPELYKSNFQRFYSRTDFYITCHFWHPKSPLIYNAEQMRSEEFSIRYVSDVSCDIPGPIASTIRSTTIENPFYGIDTKTGKEMDFLDSKALAVMSVDNLPCELPVDASKDFGNQLMEQVLSSFFNNDVQTILKRATIAENGKLTPDFDYLQDYVSEL